MARVVLSVFRPIIIIIIIIIFFLLFLLLLLLLLVLVLVLVLVLLNIIIVIIIIIIIIIIIVIIIIIIITIINNMFIMKNLTYVRKTLETGVDPRLCMVDVERSREVTAGANNTPHRSVILLCLNIYLLFPSDDY